MLQGFVFLSAMLWIFALIVMIARMVFVVDFQLIRVCITLVERPDRAIKNINLQGTSKLEMLRGSKEIYESASSWDIKWGATRKVKLLAADRSNSSQGTSIGETRVAITEAMTRNAEHSSNFDLLKVTKPKREKGLNSEEVSNNQQKKDQRSEVLFKDFPMTSVRDNSSTEFPRKRKISFLEHREHNQTPDPVNAARQILLKNAMAKQETHKHQVRSSSTKNLKSSLEQNDYNPSDVEADGKDHQWKRARNNIIKNTNFASSGDINKSITYLPTINENIDEAGNGKPYTNNASIPPRSAQIENKKLEFGDKNQTKHNAIDTPHIDKDKPHRDRVVESTRNRKRQQENKLLQTSLGDQ